MLVKETGKPARLGSPPSTLGRVVRPNVIKTTTSVATLFLNRVNLWFLTLPHHNEYLCFDEFFRALAPKHSVFEVVFSPTD